MKNFLLVILALGIGIFAAAILVNQSDIHAFPTSLLPTQIAEKGIIPTRIEIPAIGVDARIESVGLDYSRKRMANPTDTKDTAWYSLGFKPGEKGSAVISGHYDNRDGSPAVFYQLAKLKPGDLIYVYDQNHRLRFEVSMVHVYPVKSFPLERTFNSKGMPGLNLVTCAGVWNTESHNYSDRTVIYSHLTSGGDSN